MKFINIKKLTLVMGALILAFSTAQFATTGEAEAKSATNPNVTCSANLPNTISLNTATKITTPVVTGDSTTLNNYYLLVNYDVGDGYKNITKISADKLVNNQGKEISLNINSISGINTAVAKNNNKLNVSLVFKSSNTEGVDCGAATRTTYVLSSNNNATLVKMSSYTANTKPLQGVIACTVDSFLNTAMAGQKLQYKVSVTNISKNDKADAGSYKIVATRNINGIDGNDATYIEKGLVIGKLDANNSSYTKTISTTVPTTYKGESTVGKTANYTIQLRSADQSYRVPCDSGVQTLVIKKSADSVNPYTQKACEAAGRKWENGTCTTVCQNSSFGVIIPNYPYNKCASKTTKVDYSVYNQKNCEAAGRKWDANASPSCVRVCRDSNQYIGTVAEPYDKCTSGKIATLMANYQKAVKVESKCVTKAGTTAICTKEVSARVTAQNNVNTYCKQKNLGSFDPVSACKK